jgi:hypothetical protein
LNALGLEVAELQVQKLSHERVHLNAASDLREKTAAMALLEYSNAEFGEQSLRDVFIDDWCNCELGSVPTCVFTDGLIQFLGEVLMECLRYFGGVIVKEVRDQGR